MGQIVTFFSYKGGVGRTMALANVAVILAQWGKKVLVVDWDLEAPGIESYFKSYLNLEAVKQQNGVIDLLHEQLENNGNLYEKQIWRDLLTDIKITGIKGNLHLLTAGKRDNEYFRKVRSLDFKTFYSKEKKGLFFIESLRNEWKKEYDYVFIDSRTGITDTGGICTIQLPDILVLLFTATDQALTGVIEVAEKVSIALQKLPFDRLRIVSVPIPSKFDTNTEFDISNEWLNIFSSKLTEIYADWLPTSVKGRDILEITKIPYVPYFSFGEKLPVLEQGTINPSGLGYAYETLAALLGNNLELVEHLIEDRDGFVRYASRKTTSINPNVFISYSHKDEKWKDRLRPHLGILEKANRITIWDDRQIDPDGKWFNEIKKVIDRTSVAVCLISSSYLASDFINKEEIPYLLSRRGKEGMIIIPVLLKPCTWKAFPWLRELQMLPHDGKTISKDFKDNEDEVFGEVAEQIFTFLDNPKYRPPQPTSLWSPPEKID
ncbi:MAG: TIR domain-containing protein, partial [Candidatus Heimdallarchaeota archaeon]|nr:TIR domain-containing protein [Candidatus Heimdallarchaeota archaeon]